MTAITVLGLGAMGSRIAAVLAASPDHTVTVWNRSSAAAQALAATAPVAIADTARQAVATADMVISMVTDDAASGALWLDHNTGVLAAIADGAVAIEASTITKAMATELGAAAAAAGVAFLEAPVVGSRPQAEAGALFVLVGGDEGVLDRVRPVIDTYASAIRPVGPVGNAATMKLAINGLFGIQVAAYGEMVGLLERSDVPSDAAVEILSALPITSPGLQRILGLVASRDFAPNFPVSLVAKDFGYLQALAAEADATVPLVDATSAVYAAGAGGPEAELDIAGIAARYLSGADTQAVG
ncbi:MAG: NAD(P)-dependent oxidoreductase [Actinomycetota bacterium]